MVDGENLPDEFKIHKMVYSEDAEEREKALNELSTNFVSLTNRTQAWGDLLALTKDQNSTVQWNAAHSLCLAFPYVTDKTQAWNDLLALIKDPDSDVRRNAAYALCLAFPYVTDKTQAANTLLALIKDQHGEVRHNVAYALGSAFPYVTDKSQATKDLLTLTKDPDGFVRESVASALNSAFSHVTDKTQAWNDLLALTKDSDGDVRSGAASALGSAFPYVTDKTQAWNTLLALTKDPDSFVRSGAASALGSAFSHVTDKTQAANTLLALIKDPDVFVQWRAASALGSAFSHVTDKTQAWNDLLALIRDPDSIVRWRVASALGSAFPHITDKLQATKDLLALTKDPDSDVRSGAASALGSAFPHVTDKSQATKDLLALTKDPNSFVRAYAYHSLGRVNVFKATEMDEENFRSELERALEFFEKSSQEEVYLNPARFCLPFYRSFYSITFRKDDAGEEIQKYLIEAKSAVGGSKNKDKLLEAVENLSNALKEAQKPLDFNEIKQDLNAYRRYCDRVCELLDTTEEKALGASRLIRKGLPIIDERIKDILTEIQEKTKTLCKQMQGTPFEDLGKEVYQIGQTLPTRNPMVLEKKLSKLEITLSAVCAIYSEPEEACILLKKANETIYIEDRVELYDKVLSKILAPSIKKEDRMIVNSEDISINEVRMQQLADNIRLELELLKGYEDDLRYAIDPRIIAKNRREIKRQKEALALYQQEYDELIKRAQDAIEFHPVPEKELRETFDAIHQTLSEIKQNKTRQYNPQLMNEVENISEIVDDPKLDLKHKLKFSIPIIPLILSYESEVELKSGLNLRKAWQSLKERLR